MYSPGDKVVCINNKGIQNTLIEDKIYTISRNIGPKCKCGFDIVSVGISTEVPFNNCSTCSTDYIDNGNERLFRATRFVPLEHYLETEKLKNSINKPKVKTLELCE